MLLICGAGSASRKIDSLCRRSSSVRRRYVGASNDWSTQLLQLMHAVETLQATLARMVHSSAQSLNQSGYLDTLEHMVQMSVRRQSQPVRLLVQLVHTARVSARSRYQEPVSQATPARMASQRVQRQHRQPQLDILGLTARMLARPRSVIRLLVMLVALDRQPAMMYVQVLSQATLALSQPLLACRVE